MYEVIIPLWGRNSIVLEWSYKIQKYFFSQIIFQMHKSCSYYYRHSYNMARQCAGSVLRLSNLDNVSRKFQNSYIRKLPFPHEDMFQKICFSFLTNQMIKCWRKLFSLFQNEDMLFNFPWAITGCYFQPIKSKFQFQLKFQRHWSHNPRVAGGCTGCAGALGSCMLTTLLPGVWNWTIGRGIEAGL